MISRLPDSALACFAVLAACAGPTQAPASSLNPCQTPAGTAVAAPQWRGSELHLAIRRNDVAAASQLLDRADLDEKDTLGNTPLIAALSPSALFEPLLSSDTRGRAAAIQREQAARIRIVGELLRRGANPALAGPRGVTPLIVLAQWGFTAADDVRLLGDLMARGAPVDAQNEDGDTALIVASRRGKADLVKALVAHGASPGLANCRGENAAAAAVAGKHAAIVRILRADR